MNIRNNHAKMEIPTRNEIFYLRDNLSSIGDQKNFDTNSKRIQRIIYHNRDRAKGEVGKSNL